MLSSITFILILIFFNVNQNLLNKKQINKFKKGVKLHLDFYECKYKTYIFYVIRFQV